MLRTFAHDQRPLIILRDVPLPPKQLEHGIFDANFPTHRMFQGGAVPVPAPDHKRLTIDSKLRKPVES